MILWYTEQMSSFTPWVRQLQNPRFLLRSQLKMKIFNESGGCESGEDRGAETFLIRNWGRGGGAERFAQERFDKSWATPLWPVLSSRKLWILDPQLSISSGCCYPETLTFGKHKTPKERKYQLALARNIRYFGMCWPTCVSEWTENVMSPNSWDEGVLPESMVDEQT